VYAAALRRSVASRKDHRAWNIPQLDPAPCLEHFKVVLIGTRKAPSIGTVARALGAFECLSLCCVAPRVNITCRPSLNTSKGAQYLIHNAQVCDTLEEALQGTTYSVAFARWLSGMCCSYRLFLFRCENRVRILHASAFSPTDHHLAVARKLVVSYRSRAPSVANSMILARHIHCLASLLAVKMCTRSPSLVTELQVRNIPCSVDLPN
jgi:hypothetical protein